MSAAERSSPIAAARPAAARGPDWRWLLEARWRAQVQEITELSLAYHGAVAMAADGPRGEAGPQVAQRLLRRAVAARRKLADLEEALGRLAAGTFGRCEQCRSAIEPALLSQIPEARYCPRCATEWQRGLDCR